jgi:uncharacterized alpha-E superfamily protein
MLLSRVADALYWLSRYLERADHTARVVDVAVDLSLGRQTSSSAIDRLYASLGIDGAESGGISAAERAFFDAGRGSAFSYIVAARENARQVREEISTDMWEQLNALFLRLRRMSQDPVRTGRTHYVARAVTEGVHLFQGITDATMGHGEGWQYLQAGRFLERAAVVAGLLDSFLADGATADTMAPPLDQVEWVALLRSCCGLEGYCRQYTADVRRDRVAEFLLLNAESPRSVRFAAASLESALLALARYSGRRAGGRAERLAGRLHASLDYAQVDEILNEDPHAYLAGIGRQCAQIHTALYQTYIGYAVELALPA